MNTNFCDIIFCFMPSRRRRIILINRWRKYNVCKNSMSSVGACAIKRSKTLQGLKQ